MRLRLLFILLCLCVASPSYAIQYFLNPASGDDTRSGTSISNAWKTLLKVRTTVSPDDVVNIIGGTYTPDQYKGEPGTPFWENFHAKGTADHPIIIQANGTDTVVFDGQNESGWMYFFSDNATYGGHYIIIRNIQFQGYRGIAISTAGASTSTPVHHIAVINCQFRNFGMQDSGAVGAGFAHHILFRGNRITNIGDPSLPGNGVPNGQHGIYNSEGSSNIVIDNNYVEQTSAYGIVFFTHSAGGLQVQNVIIRRNTIVNAHTYPIGFSNDSFQNTFVYNNTTYEDSIPFPAIDSGHSNAAIRFGSAGTFTNTFVQNNIFYGYAENAPYWTDGSHTNLVLKNNLLRNTNVLANAYYESGNFYSVASFPGAHGGNGSASSQNDPNFVNVAGRNFTPQATAIDTGASLTTAVGGGTGSTSLTVGNAGFFFDGHNLVTGDTIQISTQPTVTITGISGNTLTLSSARTWSNGDAVGLPYAGSAPDMGAIETGVVVSGDTPSVGVFYADITNGDDTRTCDQAKVITTPRQHGTALASCMAAGSTLYYRTGTYQDFWESSIYTLRGGSSFATATLISAYPGDVVILAPVLTAGQRVFNLAMPENTYIILNKLIVNAGSTGQHAIAITGNAHHIRMSDITAQNCLESCIRIETAGNEVLNSTIASCGYNGRGCVQLGTGANNNLVQGNVITNFASGGITDRSDNYPTVTNSSNIIRANRITSESPGNAEWGIAVGRGSNGLVVNNLVYNIVGGVRIVPDASGMKVYNNTLHGNGSGILLDISALGTLIRNNILSSNTTNYQEEGSGATLQNNLCLTAGTGCAIVGDPRFTNIATGNFKQLSNAPTSVAIDTGVCLSESTPDFAGVNRPLGSTCDVGAYEVAADSGAIPPDLPTSQLQRGPYSSSFFLMNNQ